MPPHFEIREQLGLDESAHDWYDTWEAIDPGDPAIALPDADEVTRLLVDRLGVDAVDVAAITRGRPEPETDPALWWVLERCHRQLVTGLGGTGMLAWPALPRKFGLKGRFVYLYAFLAALPSVREYHRAHGVDDAVSWDTFANLAEKLRLNRSRFGEPGLDVAVWFTLHFRGTLYRLGRLEFAIETLGRDIPAAGLSAGDLTLGVHIPADGGPMSPQDCAESIDRAREFFPGRFGAGLDKPVFTCTSWLLDPQLGEFLAPESNIVRFQDRFTLTPPADKATERGEADVLLFVFDRPKPVDPATLPRDSTLRRGLADGLASGGKWQVRTGWFR